MLLRSIRLENFRQFVNEQIDFSVDPNQNVTLITDAGTTIYKVFSVYKTTKDDDYTTRNFDNLNKKVKELQEKSEVDAKIRAVLEMGIDKWRRDWIDKLILGGGSKAESIREELTAIINDWDAWQLVNHEPRLYYAKDALPVLQSRMPEVPTLFLSGEREHKKPASLMKYIPNSEFEVILDCGHMSNMEQPDKFNKAVIAFIERNE